MKKNYHGFQVQQRSNENSPVLFTFYAPAKEIIQWARVERASDGNSGVQRLLRDSRLSGIKRYLAKNPINTFTNNILVAFPEGETNTTVKTLTQEQCDVIGTSADDFAKSGFIQIEFQEEKQKPALIIDGQHRLFGAASYSDEDIPILVVAILHAKPEEMAFQFIVINNKAVKVPTSLVKSLVANYADIEVNLSDRLLTAGITYGNKSAFLTSADTSEASPFFGMLNWESNRGGEKIIDITTIETIHSYLKRELTIILSGDEDSSQAILFTIWNTIKEIYPLAWKNRCDNFFTKVSMLAMNEYVIDRIRNLASMQMVDIFSEESIKNSVKRTFAYIPEELWSLNWSAVRLQDNKAIRELIKNSFEIIANNRMNDREWHHSVKLLSED